MKTKRAVLCDGTGPHEKCVYTVMAVSDTDALTRVAEAIIRTEKEYDMAADFHGKADTNNGTPTSYMEVYNDNGDLLYTLETVGLNEVVD